MFREQTKKTMQQPAEDQVRLHEINVKGYYNQTRWEPVLKKSFGDVAYGNGKLLFKGTGKQLDVLLDYLVENEGKLRIKII